MISGRVAYEVNEGRIDTWALETHVVDHCNLRCADCCTGSPDLPERCVDVAGLARDLAAAAAVLRPQVFKLTGGEPMLHPDLAGCLRVARASGVSAQLSLTTNGFRVAEVPEEVFAGLDALTLSRYPSAPLPQRLLDLVRARCAAHGVRLREKVVDRFQVMDARRGEPAATFAGCWLRHRCHMVHAGRFYACTRPPHLGFPDDGVELHAPGLLSRLLAYLERDEPLAACAGCSGGAGEWRPHRPLPVIRAGGGTAPA
jgi:hypothetical protein